MKRLPDVSIDAPAKINLGLEVLGKREDGYHEIRSVMAMIDLFDTLTINRKKASEGVEIAGVEGVAAADNLIAKAILAFTKVTGIRSGYDVDVVKRIPSPGGLGGASSDAAAALLALNALHGEPLATHELATLAAGLGADVPFFLGSPVALASGIGTTLVPLCEIDGWIVMMVPLLTLQAKTQSLYRSLGPEDFSDGSRVNRVAASIAAGRLPDAGSLGNAFERPLYALASSLGQIRSGFIEAGAPFVAVSGAGPAHYAHFATEGSAREVASRLKTTTPPGTLLTVNRLQRRRPSPILGQP